MRIAFVNTSFGAELSDPDALLEAYTLVRCLPAAIAALGHEVDFVQYFPVGAERTRGGVRHHFVAPGRFARGAARFGAGLLGRPHWDAFVPSRLGCAALSRLEPDVVHFLGLMPPRRLLAVGRHCRRRGLPLSASFHGAHPAAHRAGRALQRRALAEPRRIFFTTRAHAAPWLEAGLIRSPSVVVECMEASSDFEWEARESARARTGMRGDPVFAWAGRLDANKDPRTALRAFERVVAQWPEARLYMAYRSGDLLPALRAQVASSQGLATRVEFVGRQPLAEMPDFLNSADVLLQASHREFSGLAVLEAMACGVVPAVTDIPSFRAMTDHGREGLLFPPGDAEALAEQVLKLGRDGIRALQPRVCEAFERRLSYEAIARRYVSCFEENLGRPQAEAG